MPIIWYSKRFYGNIIHLVAARTLLFELPTIFFRFRLIEFFNKVITPLISIEETLTRPWPLNVFAFSTIVPPAIISLFFFLFKLMEYLSSKLSTSLMVIQRSTTCSSNTLSISNPLPHDTCFSDDFSYTPTYTIV